VAELHVPSRPIRVPTAAALFDGHDAATNIVRRIVQARGADVIHYRGGVRGAMETGYQRGKIQDQSTLHEPQARRQPGNHRSQHLPGGRRFPAGD
jgi:hypothetical protein